MPIPQHLIDRFGTIEQVPDYIKKFYADREEQKEQAAEEEKARKEREEREWARIKALRKPPAKVWRIGRTLLWAAPETVDQIQPLGYWVSEQFGNRGWSAHGDYLPHPAHEAQLYEDGPARVETKYDQQALGEVYYSPVVEEVDPAERFLVSRVRYYASQSHYGPEVVNLWRRVLAGFGVVDAKVGHAGHDPVHPLNPPMTADEAQQYVDQGNARWVPVVQVLRRLEGDAPPQPETRMDRIVGAIQSYTGRRTKAGSPWVRPLRKHADMPDITVAERDEAWHRHKE